VLKPIPLDYCSIDRSRKPQLIVVIDTEEEFDWSRDFSRENTAVRSLRSIEKVQAIFDDYRITPVYVVDYPVAFQPDGYRPLREISQSGRCIVGAHLHPWVNPPFEEPVSRVNSFPGNLPPALEAKKLRVLGEVIGERFGFSPTTYKAGRYGIGPRTAEILEEQGYEVDVSVCPRMDYSVQGGPNFTAFSVWPYWFGQKHRLLEIPLSVGFVGGLRFYGNFLQRLTSSSGLSRAHLGGILSRLGLFSKVWLSPEGYTLAENIALLHVLYKEGVRIFSFAFHSPSVEPGNTPYVASRRDLERFLSQCRQFFDYFMGELGGVPTTPSALKTELSRTEKRPK
jgi:hypothetical protein